MKENKKKNAVPPKKEGLPIKNGQEEKKTEENLAKKYDWVVKLLCVCAAFILWLYVMEVESPEYETTISGIMVELTGGDVMTAENGLSLYNGSGLPISVTVAGKKSVINRMDPDEIVATADLSKITEAGRHALTIMVDLPGGVALHSKSQDTVTVYVDVTDTKVVPLRGNFTGLNLPDGYEQGDVVCEYDAITISGPKKILDNITEARVDIDYTGKTSSFDALCDVYLVNRQNASVAEPYLSYTPKKIQVEAPIYKRAIVPVQVLFQHGYLHSENCSVTVTPSVVTIKGDETAMSAQPLLKPIQLNEKDIIGNNYTKTISLSTADGTFIDGGTGEAQINVEIDPSIQTMDMFITDIEVTGADGIQYAIETEEILLTLKGPIEKLLKIRPSDVYAIVDLSGYNAESTGNATKSVQIVIDAEDAEGIYEVGQYTVSVRIN